MKVLLMKARALGVRSFSKVTFRGSKYEPTLLYENTEDTRKHMKFVAAGTSAHVFFWSLWRGIESMYPIKAIADIDSIWDISNPIWYDIGLGTSVGMIGLAAYYAKRTVANIYVPPGNTELQIRTFKFGGRVSDPIKVPLEDIHTSENAPPHSIPLGVKNHVGFFTVNPAGKFFDKNRFDLYIRPKGQALSKKELKRATRKHK